MDHKTLAAAVDSLAIPFTAEADKLWATVKEKLQETLVEAGVDKIAKLNYHEGCSAEIEVEIPGKMYGHSMNLYFFDSWHDEISPKREVKLNVGTFGSFSASMKPEVNFYIVAGAIAKNLSKLQEKFDAIDFEPYRIARNNYSKAKNELEKYDRDQKMAERLQSEHDIEAKLVPGTKLRVGTTWKNEPIYDVIERSTSKLIFLKNDYGRQTKKTEAINMILNNHWEFVA